MSKQTTEEIQIHPIANKFPKMDTQQYAALRDDIKANGLREPILMYDDMVLDGRHRLAACIELELKPTFLEMHEEATDEELLGLAMSLNKYRRHLTPSQLAAVGVDLVTSKKGGNRPPNGSAEPFDNEITNEQVADQTGASVASLKRAKAVKKASPELHEMVKDGKVPLRTAARAAKASKSKLKAAVAKGPEAVEQVAAKAPTEKHEGCGCRDRFVERFDAFIAAATSADASAAAFTGKSVAQKVRDLLKLLK